MNIKLLLDVDVNEEFASSFDDGTGRIDKLEVAHAIADRLHLNEVGNADFYRLREKDGVFTKNGEAF